MPKPYSIDLRERVVGYVEAGHSRRAAAAHFGVSVSFVVILVKNYRKTESLMPKASGGRRHSKLDPHRAFLLAGVADKDDITMPELAAGLAAAAGVQVAPASISRWLIRNGYRFKKNAAGQRARSSRHQQGAAGVAGQAPAADAA
jgi:transposase